MDSSSENRSGRMLYILDNDYGELGFTMFFLQGRELLESSTLMLPPRLYVKNKDLLPCPTHEYQSIEDIVRMVDEMEPEIVFFFSGYILANHELISIDAMAKLVEYLFAKGCKIVTSDPFFGIFSRMGPSTISGPAALRLFETEILPDQSWEYRVNATRGNHRILEQFAMASHIFKDTTHLYYSCPAPEDEPIEISTHTAAFFNPTLIDKENGPAASSPDLAAGDDSDSAGSPHWLFILGEVDYDIQVRLYGEADFLDLLEKKLHQTLAAGRRFIFLAPNECLQQLIPRAPISARKDLLGFCAYEKFISLSLNAEYVFYWNLASYSTFLRVIHGLPMFMFDEGHLVRHVKPMYDRMAHSYYQNWRPPFIDQHQALQPDVLAELSKDYKKDTDRLLENLKQLPTPEEVVAGLLQD